jgi:hypothetical protein
VLWVVQCQRERDSPAQRVANDQRPLKPERLTEVRNRAHLGAERRRCVRGPGGIAAAGPIQNDDAVVLLQPIEQRMGEVVHLAGETVNQEKRGARAFIEIVDARAVDVDETAARRHLLFDLTRRPGGKQHKADGDNNDQRGTDPGDPGNDAHLFDLRPRYLQ